MLLHVHNSLLEVERATAALREFWQERNLPEDLEVPVVMCLEEVLSNVLRHGCDPDETYDIRVRVELLDAGIEVEVSDDARPFDPLSVPPPNLNVSLEERKAGGMGVFLVRNLMDEVRYEHKLGRNHLRFRKSW